MLRVTAGALRGKKLEVPDSCARPTLSRVRQSLMNILQTRIPGARVLDLFAGSGAFAIECLSRGAAEAALCDSSAAAVKTVRKNLAACNLDAKVLHMDCLRAIGLLAKDNQRFEIIYLDPPYGQGLALSALTLALQSGLLAEGGAAVCELPSDGGEEISAPDGFEIFDVRRYGVAALYFIRRQI